jgi:FtsZ-binding cell division protein ZapB
MIEHISILQAEIDRLKKENEYLNAQLDTDMSSLRIVDHHKSIAQEGVRKQSQLNTELMEALEQIVRFKHKDGIVSDYVGIVKIAKQALAKARGEA